MMYPEDLLRSHQGPSLPPALRQPTLAAAAAAMARQPAPDRWERIWSSPAWRLAWATCAAVLLAGHLVLGLHRPQASGPTIADPGRELAAIVRLEPLRLDLVSGGAARATSIHSTTTNTEDSSS